MTTDKRVIKAFHFLPSSSLPPPPLRPAAGPREEDQPAEADLVLSASSGHRGPAIRPDALLPHGDGATNHHRCPPGAQTGATITHKLIQLLTAACLSSVFPLVSARYSGVCERAEGSVHGSSCGG